MDFHRVGLREFLEAASAGTPTPGGGAVAGVGAALASTMALMAVNFTVGKKKFRGVEAEMKESAASLRRLQEEALRMASLDMQAYSALSSAFGLPRETEEEKAFRKRAVSSAALGASEPPDKILDLAVQGLSACVRLVEAANPNLKSDVKVAAEFFLAAARSASYNIEGNLPYIAEGDIVSALAERTASRVAEAERLYEGVVSGAAGTR